MNLGGIHGVLPAIFAFHAAKINFGWLFLGHCTPSSDGENNATLAGIDDVCSVICSKRQNTTKSCEEINA